MMGKPPVEVFEKFKKKFFKLSEEAGLEQYLVPYLMSSHPGATMNDAVDMALWLKQWGYSPEQVQDFYPTPGTASTVMFYTGIDPFTNKKVYCETDYHQKQLQRALLQWSKPQNAPLVREALKLCRREDLIGFTKDCLVRPDRAQGFSKQSESTSKKPLTKKSSANTKSKHTGDKRTEKGRDNSKKYIKKRK
jgi:radical SAM superfamily enzyme YgiQ (UPF0313 family)